MIIQDFPNHFHDIGFLVHSIRGGSYLGFFLFSIVVSYIIPIPEIVILILIGYVAQIADLNLVLVFLLSASGSIVGDNIAYRLSFFGNKYVERFNQKMRQSKLIQYEYLVLNNIGKTIYFLRFITGIRFFGPVISGTLGVKWKKFFVFNGSANILHAMLFISIGYFFSHKILLTIAEAEIVRNILLFSSVFIVGVLLSIFSVKKEKTQ